MTLLRILTLVYAAVLVAALTAALGTIAAYLWRVSRALAQTRAALALVRERTQPLRGHLERLEKLTSEHVLRVEQAAARIEQAVERLGAPASAAAP
jgi:hypothetical protein